MPSLSSWQEGQHPMAEPSFQVSAKPIPTTFILAQAPTPSPGSYTSGRRSSKRPTLMFTTTPRPRPRLCGPPASRNPAGGGRPAGGHTVAPSRYIRQVHPRSDPFVGRHPHGLDKRHHPEAISHRLWPFARRRQCTRAGGLYTRPLQAPRLCIRPRPRRRPSRLASLTTTERCRAKLGRCALLARVTHGHLRRNSTNSHGRGPSSIHIAAPQLSLLQSSYCSLNFPFFRICASPWPLRI